MFVKGCAETLWERLVPPRREAMSADDANVARGGRATDGMRVLAVADCGRGDTLTEGVGENA